MVNFPNGQFTSKTSQPDRKGWRRYFQEEGKRIFQRVFNISNHNKEKSETTGTHSLCKLEWHMKGMLILSTLKHKRYQELQFMTFFAEY